MRIVAAALLAAVLWVDCGAVFAEEAGDSVSEVEHNSKPISIEVESVADALPNATTGVADGDSFFDEQFVYIDPPEFKAGDPRFYSGSFEYVPSLDGKPGGKLVKTVWGVVPLSSAAHGSTAADSASNTSELISSPPSTVASVSGQPASQPASTMTGALVAVNAAASGAPTARPKPTATLVPTATSPPTATTSPTVASAPPAAASPTPTSSPTVAPVSKATTSGAATPGAITAKPLVVNISGTIPVDIEDPRFYRGSFVYDPEERQLTPGIIDAPPVVAEKSASGSSTGCEAGGCAPPVAASPSGSFPRSGRAMYYNPGIMAQVLSFRMQSNHVSTCPECVGYVALLNRSDLNRKVWIEWDDGDIEGPFLVIDCAAKQHVESLLSRNWVVDVDYATAMRRGMYNPLPVTVWDHRP